MRIEHIALFCRDLERMRQFFLDYFEGISNEQYHNPRTGLRTYILTFPEVTEQREPSSSLEWPSRDETRQSHRGARLELMQRPDTIEVDSSKPNIGFIHISFALGSKEAVDDKTRELTDAGYKVVSGPRTTGDGYYESCILGPEGIQIELMEQRGQS